MRKLKLWNNNRTQSIDLSTKNYLLSDVSGLGTNYSINEINSTVGAIIPSFEDISLLLYFGIEGNAYSIYKDFMDFIVANGFKNFVLEYQPGASKRYCDVFVRNVPKTQKTNYNVLSETVVLKRISPWYEFVEIVAPGEGLSFETAIVNNYYLPLNVNLYVELGFEGMAFPFIVTKNTGEEVLRIEVTLKTSHSLTINSETKEAYYTNTITQEKINAYDSIDHTHESFIILERGNYNLQDPNGTPLTLTYKKWVAD